jgi:hypothetical protein
MCLRTIKTAILCETGMMRSVWCAPHTGSSERRNAPVERIIPRPGNSVTFVNQKSTNRVPFHPHQPIFDHSHALLLALSDDARNAAL